MGERTGSSKLALLPLRTRMSVKQVRMEQTLLRRMRITTQQRRPTPSPPPSLPPSPSSIRAGHTGVVKSKRGTTKPPVVQLRMSIMTEEEFVRIASQAPGGTKGVTGKFGDEGEREGGRGGGEGAFLLTALLCCFLLGRGVEEEGGGGRGGGGRRGGEGTVFLHALPEGVEALGDAREGEALLFQGVDEGGVRRSHHVGKREDVFTEKERRGEREGGRAAGVEEEGEDGTDPSAGEAGSLEEGIDMREDGFFDGGFEEGEG